MTVETVCTFEEAAADAQPGEDFLATRKESIHTLVRAALEFLGRDWLGIQGVHVQVIYTERNTNQVDFVSGSCGSPLMVSNPSLLFALLKDALQAEATRAEAHEANVLGFDECRLKPM